MGRDGEGGGGVGAVEVGDCREVSEGRRDGVNRMLGCIKTYYFRVYLHVACVRAYVCA